VVSGMRNNILRCFIVSFLSERDGFPGKAVFTDAARYLHEEVVWRQVHDLSLLHLRPHEGQDEGLVVRAGLQRYQGTRVAGNNARDLAVLDLGNTLVSRDKEDVKLPGLREQAGEVGGGEVLELVNIDEEVTPLLFMIFCSGVGGEPRVMPSGKSDAEWLLMTGKGLACIYNYKDGCNWLGGKGKKVEEIGTWHIGAHSTYAARAVLSLMEGRISAG